ncbi:MAG: bifunctional DNA primase/polymerase [Nanoarchaeota archaeon]|nr:bifunctional DNA primase/polymerase [Nanoarchaeota archaeon]
MKNKTNPRLQAALKYFKKYNYCVIPWKNVIKKGEKKPSKVPIIKWLDYQKKKCTEEEINEWWTKWPEANIGIVTGAISGIMVFDTDDKEADEYFQSLLPESFLCPIVQTPSGGKHYYFKATEQEIGNQKAIHGKRLDFRGDGGFVGCPPSTNGSGSQYVFLKNLSIKDLALTSIPNNIVTMLKDNIYNINFISLYKEDVDQSLQESTPVYKCLQDGRRDEDLFHIAHSLIKTRTPIEEVSQVLEILARNCNPPFPEKEIYIKIDSALKRAERRDRNLSQEIEDWLCLQDGYFLSTDVYQSLQVSTREDKKNVWIILKRLCDKGLIEKHGTKSGQYRKISNEIEPINWYDANEKDHISVQYPLNLHDYVLTLPKNIVIIAGSKDAGKTCFLLNIACLNRDGSLPVKYFSSEMGEVEMKKRLVKLSNRLQIDLKEIKNKISWIDRSANYADVIYPEALNIIDFLEITKDFYEVGDMVKNIYHKLTTGVAVIGIQKPSSRDMPIGGEKGLEKARVAIAIDNSRAKILVGKNWATDSNPRGLECSFKIIDGSEMLMSEPWDKMETTEPQRRF